jgi:Restriction endonuclease
MSVLRPIEMTLINSLFGMNSGWVLDFSNPTFAELFSHEVGIDIYDQAYEKNGPSKGKRLKAFLQIGQKVAIVKALTALWEYREDSRLNRGEAETVNNAKERLSAVIQRLGGSAIPSLSVGAKTASISHPITKSPIVLVLAKLEEDFSLLHQLSEQAQARGFAFEHFLKNWFDAWGLKARASFRTTGEQIDGSFQHGSSTYLVEAKWHNSKTDATTLHGFQGKLLERPDWTRGLFVSYAGFSDQSFSAFTARRIILMDGMDIFLALRRNLNLGLIIEEKARSAVEKKQPFAKVADLFP